MYSEINATSNAKHYKSVKAVINPGRRRVINHGAPKLNNFMHAGQFGLGKAIFVLDVKFNDSFCCRHNSPGPNSSDKKNPGPRHQGMKRLQLK